MLRISADIADGQTNQTVQRRSSEINPGLYNEIESIAAATSQPMSERSGLIVSLRWSS